MYKTQYFPKVPKLKEISEQTFDLPKKNIEKTTHPQKEKEKKKD